MVPVILQLLIAGLFIGLVGIICMVARDIFGDDHHSHHKRQESASLDHHDGRTPSDRSSRESKTDVGELAVRRES
jgi:hypothetical protein